ncbi:hypothetical protein IWW55_003132 [Coemansia sp. RSA 2706]
MYIPASSTSFLQSRCSSAATLTVEHGQEPAGRHPSLSLRLQPGCRAFYPFKKQAARAAYTPPEVVRKDSGEIVRPCLRRRSATTAGTPTGERSASPVMRTPRFVHFGTDLECVRWFLKAQSPRAVREDAEPEGSGAGPTDSAQGRRSKQVRLTALRRPTPSFAVFEAAPVVVEQVELADSRLGSAALRGTVKVHNTAFEKRVVVRYSFDQWRTAGEVAAEFSRTLTGGQGARPGVDRFAFRLALPAALPATVALCVRYNAAGAEHWDNNGGANYVFRVAVPAAPAIADDDCEPRLGAAESPELRAPRRLSFGGSSSAKAEPRFAAPTPADTRRYMAQSAALFGAAPELPLYQETAWRGGLDAAGMPSPPPSAEASPPLASAYHHAFLPFAAGSDASLSAGSPLGAGDFASYAAAASSIRRPVSLPPANAAGAPMRIGSPIRRAGVFDADGTVRTGSPLAWSHNTTASAQC